MSVSAIEPCPLRVAGRVAAPFVVLSGALVILITTAGRPNQLSAGSSRVGPDYDMDGLTDIQESVLGTDLDQPDTDGDGYHDLEEVARHSDPVDALSVPLDTDLDLGMYAHTDDGFLNLGTAIYVKGGNAWSLHFTLGVVIDGVPIVVSPLVYRRGTRGFVCTATQNPGDKIVVLEMPFPETVIQQRGSLSIYATVEDPSPLQRAGVVDVTNLVDFGGVIMRVETSPPSVSGGLGFVYRPLAGSGIPSSWSSGEICWQDTAAVGTNGASIVHEVQAASCQDFDSYCSASDCSASVGTSLELPDPGSLLGG